MTEKKNTYITLHKNFVRTDIEYEDKTSGETKKFNAVTLPKGATIDGVDVGSYQFSPLFVNQSRFRGENFYDIPLLNNQEVWLKRSVLDSEGNPVLDENGRPEKDTVKVMPVEIKEALDKQRSDYLQARAAEREQLKEISENKQGLGDKAAEARNGAGALGNQSQATPHRENVRA